MGTNCWMYYDFVGPVILNVTVVLDNSTGNPFFFFSKQLMDLDESTVSKSFVHSLISVFALFNLHVWRGGSGF